MTLNKLAQLTLSLVCSLVLLLGAQTAFADQDPVTMLKEVTGQVMDNLKDNKEHYRNNPNKLYEMVNSLILPHADFEEMSRWVVGKKAWVAADAAAQKAFVSELKTLVIRSYARSLVNYTDQTIEFLPMRNPAGEKVRIQVPSVIRNGGQTLKLDYRLLKAAGDWRVYDIVIEGVSLMQGYRAQFADDVRRNGVEGALSKLRQGNKR
jgi:phospholipid transport system substrate-binding protein